MYSGLLLTLVEQMNTTLQQGRAYSKFSHVHKRGGHLHKATLGQACHIIAV